MAIKQISISKIFSLATEPDNAVIDRFWFDTTNNLLKRYDGTSWKPISVSSDDVVVLSDGNKVSLTSYLNTQISALVDGIDSKQDKLSYYKELNFEGESFVMLDTANSITIGNNSPNVTIGSGYYTNINIGYSDINSYTTTNIDGQITGNAIRTSISSDPSDRKLLSEKAIATTLLNKQDKLTVGDGIKIENNVISTTAKGTVSQVNGVDPDDSGYVTITSTNIPDIAKTYVTKTELAGVDTAKANIDATNIDNANLTSWKSKLGINTIETTLDSKQDKLKAYSEVENFSADITTTGTIDLNSGYGTTITGGEGVTIKTGNPAWGISLDAGTSISGDLCLRGNLNGAITGDHIDEYLKSVDNPSGHIPSTKAVQDALDDKQDKLIAGSNIDIASDNTISVSGLTKSSIGLDNVDNTSDANKPISTATQAALDTKQDKLTYYSEVITEDNDSKVNIGQGAYSINLQGGDIYLNGGSDGVTLDGNSIELRSNNIYGNGVSTAIPTSSASNTKITSEKAVADALILKQNKSDLTTSISSDSTDEQYPTAKAVYDFANVSVSSTTEITITPTASQTATSITSALAKKARVIVIPNINNIGAVYIKESSTYSSINPIYPDPTNNVYEFSNMQNVKIFADSIGDSVDLVIEYRG